MATHNGVNGKVLDNGTFESLLRSLSEDAAAPQPTAPKPATIQKPAAPPKPLLMPKPAPQPAAEVAPVVRSYYARSVEAALEQAHAELGPDAILVQSRRTPIELRHLGPYELIFTYDANAPAESAPVPVKRMELAERRGPVNARTAASDAAPANVEPPLSAELAELRAQLEEIRHAVVTPKRASASRGKAAANASNATVHAARDLMIDAGFDRTIAEQILSAAAPELAKLEEDKHGKSKTASALPANTIWSALRGEIAQRLPRNEASRTRGETAGVIAFAGPPGAGKTTALVKLALLRSAEAARPIHLISADSYRIGAAEQLKTYAAILGADIDFVDTPRAIAQAVEANRHKELILIDTPGLSGSNFELLDELTHYLSREANVERHLVLNATMRARDLQRAAAQYENFRPTGLVFTHLDETDGFGALCSASIATAKPVTYLSAGQQIPEDLEAATHDRVVALVCGAGHAAREGQQ